MKIEKQIWGEYKGNTIWLYTISGGNTEVTFTNYGCTILSIQFNGRNVILGYPTLPELIADKYYMGCMVGRYAGRISSAFFKIDGTQYDLTPNDGTSGNHLHGGINGFNKMAFTEVAKDSSDEDASITFSATSDHLDEGYPGTVTIEFTLKVDINDLITFSYIAKPDRPTHINLTHHLYYNLGGMKAVNQYLSIRSDSIVEVSENYIPTGSIITVPAYADFTQPKKIPATTDFNECYVLKKSTGNGPDAELADIASGIKMELSTTCPAIIFYTGQFLDEPFFPKEGICLETQYFPDAPNHQNFPSTLYLPDKVFQEQTSIHFKNII